MSEFKAENQSPPEVKNQQMRHTWSQVRESIPAVPFIYYYYYFFVSALGFSFRRIKTSFGRVGSHLEESLGKNTFQMWS